MYIHFKYICGNEEEEFRAVCHPLLGPTSRFGVRDSLDSHHTLSLSHSLSLSFSHSLALSHSLSLSHSHSLTLSHFLSHSRHGHPLLGPGSRCRVRGKGFRAQRGRGAGGCGLLPPPKSNVCHPLLGPASKFRARDSFACNRLSQQFLNPNTHL